MGRSRGGLTTKIHAVADAAGLPIRYELSPGQTHDSRAAATLLADLPPDSFLVADKAYDAEWIRDLIEHCDAVPIIPDRKGAKTRHAFSKPLYRLRNRIERGFNKLKQFRRIATHYEKPAADFLAMINIATVRIWLRAYESTTRETLIVSRENRLRRRREGSFANRAVDGARSAAVAFSFLPWLALLGWLSATAWFLCDDAFISVRYARNLLEGHGLAFNPGDYVEGYTNFLWVLELVALWGLLGVPPEQARLGCPLPAPSALSPRSACGAPGCRCCAGGGWHSWRRPSLRWWPRTTCSATPAMASGCPTPGTPSMCGPGMGRASAICGRQRWKRGCISCCPWPLSPRASTGGHAGTGRSRCRSSWSAPIWLK